ncbi:DgyrCDS7887 [Dimorphilus gyrociliatus]|uniref:DgyrCDS7887 n=1 Tax=Dimorphilus gyrociliatus TaxID=2664684 RepID=A0A7I8VU59_9ANNE|nr:DgyrCDS7887 [Dimorphilus gyrociliatus]
MIRQKISNPSFGLCLSVIGKIYTQFVLSYALVSFALFSADKWGVVYWEVWYILHIMLIVWFLVRGKLIKLAKDPQSSNGEVNRAESKKDD